jgi:hypothetical protein
MKTLYFSPTNEQKPLYNFSTNGVTEEHISPTGDGKKVVFMQKDSLPEIRDTGFTVEKKSRFVGFNWEEAVSQEKNEIKAKDLVVFSLKDAIFGEVDQETLKKGMGEDHYKQYLKTLDTSSEGLISSRKFDKFI